MVKIVRLLHSRELPPVLAVHDSTLLPPPRLDRWRRIAGPDGHTLLVDRYIEH